MADDSGKISTETGAAESLSFEDAYRQLQDLVKKMEQGALPLADSVAAYEQAMKLKAYCEQLLKQAEIKIEALAPNGD
jgi:exodeoxyribonuclease VII small subunit